MKKILFSFTLFITMSYSFTGYDVLGKNYIENKTIKYSISGYTDAEARVLLKNEAQKRINIAKKYLGTKLYDAFVEEGYSFEDILWYISQQKEKIEKIENISLKKYLSDITMTINQNTPLLVDYATKLNYVNMNKMIQTYDFTLLDMIAKDINNSLFSDIKINLIKATCKTPSKVAFLKYGYIYEYKYYDKNRKFIKKFTLDSIDCKLNKYKYEEDPTLVEYLMLSSKLSYLSFPKMLNNKARVDSIKYNRKLAKVNTKITFVIEEDDSKYLEYMKLLKKQSSETSCKDPGLYTAYTYGISLSVSFYKKDTTFIKEIMLDLDNCNN